MTDQALSLKVLGTGLGLGLVFALLDGVFNANPLAQRLMAAYKPIARDSVNAPLGLAFDLVSGVVMAVLFVVLSPSLPGGPALKGIAFGLLVWFFRVAMGVASQAVMFTVPPGTLMYLVAAGAAEMTILGLLYGLTLRATT